MRTRRIVAAPALVATLLLVAGCSGNGGGDANAGDAAVPARVANDEPGAASRRSAVSDDVEGFDATASGVLPERAAGKNRPAPQLQERAVISTGTVTLRSKDVAKARFDLQKVLDEHRGEITDEQTATDTHGRTDRSRLVLRVPAQDFDEVMQALERIPGTDLASAKRSSEDVTTQVIDTEVRVRAQKASIERIEALLARARTIRDIVWIESQLTRRQTELDSLERQQAYLEDQTSMSTVNVFLERIKPKAVTTQPKDDTGFLSGLRGGLDALSSAGTAAATAIGALLPFGVLLALLGLPGWWLLRRRIRSGRDPLPAP